MAEHFKSCPVQDCNRNAHGSDGGRRGWCRSHYDRWLRHGDPLGGAASPGEPLAFIDEAAAYKGDDCLIWPFADTGKGYGMVWLNGRKHVASRVVCEIVHGEPPAPKYEAAHSCGNRRCVNPRHVQWKTSTENMADKIIHGTSNRGHRHGNVRLTEAEVREIRSLQGQMCPRMIGEKFGVSRGAVRAILQGENWSWLK